MAPETSAAPKVKSSLSHHGVHTEEARAAKPQLRRSSAVRCAHVMDFVPKNGPKRLKKAIKDARSMPYLQLSGYVKLETNKLKPLMEALAL